MLFRHRHKSLLRARKFARGTETRFCVLRVRIKRPLGTFLPKTVGKSKSLDGDSQWNALQEFCRWIRRIVDVSQGLGFPELNGWTLTRPSQLPPPLALPLRGSSEPSQKQDPSQQKSTHARLNRHDCRGSTHRNFFRCAFVLLPALLGCSYLT